jgi:hypothetical protein
VSVMPVVCARLLRSRVAKLCVAAVGPPVRKVGNGAALASKAAPEGAVETDLPPRQNVPGLWLPGG